MTLALAQTLPSRGQLFTVLAALCCLNWFWADMAAALDLNGLAHGLGLSWGFWIALPLALRLALLAPSKPVDSQDLVVAGICLILVLTPVRQLGALGATLTAIWFFMREPDGSPLRGAAAILLTITLGLFWSDVALLAFAQPLKALDAGLVGLIAGARIEDNVVYFLRGEEGYVLAEGCTSVQNASLALMLWMAIARTFRPKTQLRDLVVGVGVFGTVMAANLVRLALMAQDQQAFDLLHSEAGFTVLNAIITGLALAWVAFDVRHELFR